MDVEKLTGVVNPLQRCCASVHKQLLTSTGMQALAHSSYVQCLGCKYNDDLLFVSESRQSK